MAILFEVISLEELADIITKFLSAMPYDTLPRKLGELYICTLIWGGTWMGLFRPNGIYVILFIYL